jgi:hypothetical protein
MKINPIKANMTEVTLDDGTRVLFSYKTPVAAVIKIDGMEQAVRTDKKWSQTTSRHISEWAKTFPPYLNNWDTKPQDYFEHLG